MPKSENLTTLTPRNSATVRRTKSWPHFRSSLALGLQRGVNSISLQCIPWPVACSEWGAWPNFDVRFWGQMTPKVKIFENVFQHSLTGHRTIGFVTKCDENRPLRSSRKVAWFTKQSKKTRAPRDSSQPPFWPKWVDRAPNSLNIVNPWPVYVY